MEFAEFVRTPFKIEAFQITDENLEEVCDLIGTEIKTKGDARHIVLDRRVVQTGFRAVIGGWVTRMGDRLRYYSPASFESQFTPMTPVWASYFSATEEYDPNTTEDVSEEAVSYLVEAEDLVPAEEDIPVEINPWVTAPDVAGGDL